MTLAVAEARLKSIYENREFTPAAFQGKWLADSSGYLTLEPSNPGAEPDIVKYDAETGKRSIFIGADQLVVPGSKQRLFVQRFTQTGQWLFDSKSGELKKLPKEAPQPASADTFSPQAEYIVFRRGRNLSLVEVATGGVTPALHKNSRWSPQVVIPRGPQRRGITTCDKADDFLCKAVSRP